MVYDSWLHIHQQLSVPHTTSAVLLLLQDMRVVFVDGTVLDTADTNSREAFLRVSEVRMTVTRLRSLWLASRRQLIHLWEVPAATLGTHLYSISNTDVMVTCLECCILLVINCLLLTPQCPCVAAAVPLPPLRVTAPCVTV